MIQLYTGDGKGKTTAAVGQAIRAAGAGYRVIFCQFMKGGESGELEILARLPQVQIYRCEREFPFYNAMTDKDRKEITDIHNELIGNLIRIYDAWNEEREKMTGQAESLMMVLDEITYPLNWGLVDASLFEGLVNRIKETDQHRNMNCRDENGIGNIYKPGIPQMELVLTGRQPDQLIVDNADYITEMKKLRHPFDDGIQARKGIEY